MRTYRYADAMSDPAEAALFTESQHAGSLGAAAFLSKQIELPGVSSGGEADLWAPSLPPLPIRIITFRLLRVAVCYLRCEPLGRV